MSGTLIVVVVDFIIVDCDVFNIHVMCFELWVLGCLPGMNFVSGIDQKISAVFVRIYRAK